MKKIYLLINNATLCLEDNFLPKFCKTTVALFALQQVYAILLLQILKIMRSKNKDIYSKL